MQVIYFNGKAEFSSAIKNIVYKQNICKYIFIYHFYFLVILFELLKVSGVQCSPWKKESHSGLEQHRGTCTCQNFYFGVYYPYKMWFAQTECIIVIAQRFVCKTLQDSNLQPFGYQPLILYEKTHALIYLQLNFFFFYLLFLLSLKHILDWDGLNSSVDSENT